MPHETFDKWLRSLPEDRLQNLLDKKEVFNFMQELRRWGIQAFNRLPDSEQNILIQTYAHISRPDNKCGLLPSELLKQRDELRDALSFLLKRLHDNGSIDRISDEDPIETAEKALHSTRP